MNSQYLTTGFLIHIGAYLGIGLCVVAVIVMAYHLLIFYLNHKRPLQVLTVTPPHFTGQPSVATEKLFAVLHGLNNTRSLRDKLLHRSVIVSAEIVSTRAEGIHYQIVASPEQCSMISHAITSYLPDARVEKTELTNPGTMNSKTINFYQTGHFAFGLDHEQSHQTPDLLAYMTSVMTNLQVDEAVQLQFVFKPVRPREAATLRARLLRNEDVLNHLSGGNNKLGSLVKNILHKLLFGMLDAISDAYYTPSTTQHKYQYNVPRDNRPARTLSSHEQLIADGLRQKLSQPLFAVAIRANVQANDPAVITERINALKTSLTAYENNGYQSLKANSFLINQQYRSYMYFKRMPALRKRYTSILSSSELAKLYTLTQSVEHRTDNLVTSLSRTLAAPVSLKRGNQFDVVLGENEHHGSSTLIGLTKDERERHVYVIGGTGNGKTTMLQYAIVQDIRAGKGVAVIDPHGDMASTILKYIPKERIKDVIYLNPDDSDYPISMNLLEVPAGLTGSELLRERDRVTESVISVLRKVFSDDDSGGHRIEYILRNTIQTALTLDNPTLFTIFDLLTDDKFQRSVTNRLEDGPLKNFWQNELGKAGGMQKVKMSAGVTSKIGRFEFSIATKRFMGQPKSTIQFDDILQEGKILICNFSKGRLGEDTSALFGTAILAKLQLAANRRDQLPPEQRKPFYLYVDEFQNFATMPFVQMLSEARKYKLFLTMAEQSTTQQAEQRLVNIILANVGTVVCFRTGSPIDERLVLPLFYPFINQGEIANLPSYNFYMRIAAMTAQEPLSGKTLLLDSSGNQQIAQTVIASSLENYAHPIEQFPVESTESIETEQVIPELPPEVSIEPLKV